jgi:hypothetical protein
MYITSLIFSMFPTYMTMVSQEWMDFPPKKWRASNHSMSLSILAGTHRRHELMRDQFHDAPPLALNHGEFVERTHREW